jgi:hypothetical protein
MHSRGVRTLTIVALLGVGGLCAACGEGQDLCANAGVVETPTVLDERRSGIGLENEGPLPPQVGSLAAKGVDCGDGPRAFTVAILRGVPPEVAVAEIQPGERTLYISEGFFLTHPSHPLHRWLFGRDDRPDQSRNRRCAPRAAQVGTVTHLEEFDGYLKLDVSDGTSVVRIDARTVLDVRREFGVPRVRVGDRVRVEAVRCGPYRTVARRVSAA